jgi:hypothetical protein
MTIKVLVSSIDNEQIQEILDYYNFKKSHDEEPLEILDRCEGGFKIKITHMKDALCDNNKKIKQLRWRKGYLLTQQHISFSKQEELLLYNSLVNVLGNNNVILFE